MLNKNPNGIWRGYLGEREGNFKFIDVRIQEDSEQPQTGVDPEDASVPRSQSVSSLLSALSLERLTPLFVLNGFDSVGDILDITEADLQYLGIQEYGIKGRESVFLCF